MIKALFQMCCCVLHVFEVPGSLTGQRTPASPGTVDGGQKTDTVFIFCLPHDWDTPNWKLPGVLMMNQMCMKLFQCWVQTRCTISQNSVQHIWVGFSVCQMQKHSLMSGLCWAEVRERLERKEPHTCVLCLSLCYSTLYKTGRQKSSVQIKH